MIENKRSLEEAKKVFYEKYQMDYASIGEYKEKAIHFILKNYFEVDSNKMEVKIDGKVCDILNEYGIIEIQTRNFERLRKKIEIFLKNNELTIVYPIINNKRITWLNSKNDSDYNRMSPLHMNLFSSFKELYKIKEFLKNEHLHFCFVIMDVLEFKNLDGFGLDKKKKASSFNKIPLEIIESVYFENYKEFIKIFNDDEGEFTSKTLAKKKKIKLKDMQIALNVLNYLEIVTRIGCEGRNYLYKVNK